MFKGGLEKSNQKPDLYEAGAKMGGPVVPDAVSIPVLKSINVNAVDDCVLEPMIRHLR
jgi:hypothetical protein